MENTFESVWELVQKRVEAGVRLNFLTKNITPSKKMLQDELDKRVVMLVDKLCDLIWSK